MIWTLELVLIIAPFAIIAIFALVMWLCIHWFAITEFRKHKTPLIMCILVDWCFGSLLYITKFML